MYFTWMKYMYAFDIYNAIILKPNPQPSILQDQANTHLDIELFVMTVLKLEESFDYFNEIW